ncbi:serine/threonine-protein kinase [Streptomyces sp. V4-01]|uniref:non-specific serine/threonine protein kinase n=1 Tax=Actinacidiphila polyblastidii TaxID=3110430 RepID=A0ABU7P9U9_9ACTN|nr:serine/threonine-protein kinase [Streptomyces sp. V4-01]
MTDLFMGRYRLGPVIGRGAAASVHRALDERLMREVAVKVFRQDADPDLVRRFEVEARLLAQLRHPGLVEIFDFGHTAQGPYLVLELLTGPTLRDLLRSGPRPLAETLRTGLDLAQTLAYVHGQGVVHRDVKPANILLDQHGRPRLADFGISRVVDTAGSTRTGMVMGTAAYLAPEQVRGQGAGPAADVYALGLVLIESLTAERAYSGPPAEAAVARLRCPPRVPAGLPRSLARTLHQMTCDDPEKRISAADCAIALRTTLGSTDTPLEATAAAPGPADGQDAGRTAQDVHLRAAGRHRYRPAAAVAAALAGTGLVWSLVAAGSAGHPQLSPPTPAPSSSAPSRAAPRSTTAEPSASTAVSAHPTGPGAATTGAPATTRMPAGGPAPASGKAEVAKGRDKNAGHGHGKGHGK